jgi:hypothetical protein
MPCSMGFVIGACETPHFTEKSMSISTFIAAYKLTGIIQKTWFIFYNDIIE